MAVSRDYHTKSERERQIPYDIPYMWNLKYDINKPKTEIESWIQSRLVVVMGKKVGGGMESEVGVARCQLFCVVCFNWRLITIL